MTLRRQCLSRTSRGARQLAQKAEPPVLSKGVSTFLLKNTVFKARRAASKMITALNSTAASSSCSLSIGSFCDSLQLLRISEQKADNTDRHHSCLDSRFVRFRSYTEEFFIRPKWYGCPATSK